MLKLRQTQNGQEIGLTDKELNIILDALLHELERHNTAADLVTDPQAREVIKAAKNKVFAVHQALCALIYDPEADNTKDEEKAAQIAAKYFADFDPARHRGSDSEFIITLSEWWQFCQAHGIAYPSRTFDNVLHFHFVGTKEDKGRTSFSTFRDYLKQNRIL